ncbi:MAG: 16S rRNA (uracil(1498)-N(3))-methyltransferase [Nitrospira sp.]|nr:16S rRNA (uracil(1498)-N(3))-methyltransferase [Nitrospira sp.]
MPVFFITADQIQNGTATITGPLCDHLSASLRLRVGETIWLGDEHRQRYLIKTTHLDRRLVTGQIINQLAGPAPTHPAVILGQALLKGERMDWVIQKATELGMAFLLPIVTSHAIVRPKTERHHAQQERWQKIALEASQQSERWEVPEIAAPCDATAFFEAQSSASCRLILSERSEGLSLATVALPSKLNERVVMAIGPEGGWTQEELDQALTQGFLPVSLGKRILRAETATLAALSVIQSRLGELG